MTPEPRQPADLDPNMRPLAGSSVPLYWREASAPPFRLSGFPWFDRDGVYRRLPVLPAGRIECAVSELADCTAGGQVAFQSDTRHLAVRVKLAGPATMNHMPATGQCGFDLYLGEPGRQRYHNTVRYDIRETGYEVELFEHPESALRTFTLNFPLYQGVKEVQIGLCPEARVLAPPAWSDDRPVIIYGTSITQGGCASRPGLAYTNIASRALNREIINLGFSGNGCGHPEVLGLMAEIPQPGLWVLDYDANAGSHDALRKSLPIALEVLRAARTDVPILVVSRIVWARDFSHAESARNREIRAAIQREAVAQARAAGDSHIHFLDGGHLLGADADECTVDGVHPNDLGFVQIARALAPELQRLSR
ncbi:MAG: SGNH/GDSL hydrolase family protein [Terrimicrobiaceae bacterium]